MYLRLLAITICASTAHSSFAQPDTNADAFVTIAPFSVSADSARRTPSNGAGLQIGYLREWGDRPGWLQRWREHLSWEINYSYTVLDTGSGFGTDHYQTAVGADVSYRFDTTLPVTPFVWAGAGIVENDVWPDQLDAVDAYYRLGAGLTSRTLTPYDIQFRGRIGYMRDGYMAGMEDWRIELGVLVPLGRSRTVEIERVVVREVEIQAPPQIVYREPLDSDGDGVADSIDRCPNTLTGAIVDGTGCIQAAQSIELTGVRFEFGLARLTESAARILDRAVAALRDQPALRVEIAGHTDGVGSADVNLTLSQARADAVRDYLVAGGIEIERLTALGYGETEPLTSEITDQDRAVNRRVELRIQ